MSTVKKIFRSLINILSIAVILFSIFVLLTVVMTSSGGVPEFMGYSAFRVTTGSMDPTLPVGTLILVHHVEPEEIKPDDIISFYSSDPELQGSINTHRVTGVTREGNGEIVFTTKGDANPIEDRYPVKGSSLIGVMVFSSYAIGTVVRIVSNPLVFIPLILLPLIVIIVMNFVKTVRVTKQMMLEEEKRAKEEEARKASEEGLLEKEEDYDYNEVPPDEKNE